MDDLNDIGLPVDIDLGCRCRRIERKTEIVGGKLQELLPQIVQLLLRGFDFIVDLGARCARWHFCATLVECVERALLAIGTVEQLRQLLLQVGLHNRIDRLGCLGKSERSDTCRGDKSD